MTNVKLSAYNYCVDTIFKRKTQYCGVVMKFVNDMRIIERR